MLSNQDQNNFRYMHKIDLSCDYGCNVESSQEHLFSSCTSIQDKRQTSTTLFNDIYCEASRQKEVIKDFLKIETVRKENEAFTWGGNNSQDPCTSAKLADGATV